MKRNLPHESRAAFAWMAASEEAGTQGIALARSIRAFAGSLADSPIFVLIPKPTERIPTWIRRELGSLDGEVVPFETSAPVLQFPFAPKAFASAIAEEHTVGKAELLVWMDTDTLVVQEPTAFLLAAGKKLGARPVHLLWIGPRYDQPLDPFWSLVWRRFGVQESASFAMTSCVDRVAMRPYFNAGLLVVRPEAGLLRGWRENFSRLFCDKALEPFYAKNELYRIFVHQAVLAATALATLKREEVVELPESYNYPLHLHARYPTERRPHALEELTTLRYEVPFEELLSWEGMGGPLRDWIERTTRELCALKGKTSRG